jgi:hypothetical protein
VASDTLTLDTATNSATLNGADRFGSVSGALIADMALRPGDTIVTFDGTEPAPAPEPRASLVTTWRDATH